MGSNLIIYSLSSSLQYYFGESFMFQYVGVHNPAFRNMYANGKFMLNNSLIIIIHSVFFIAMLGGVLCFSIRGCTQPRIAKDVCKWKIYTNNSVVSVFTLFSTAMFGESCVSLRGHTIPLPIH